MSKEHQQAQIGGIRQHKDETTWSRRKDKTMAQQKQCFISRLFSLIATISVGITWPCFADDASNSYSEALRKAIRAIHPDVKGRLKVPGALHVGHPWDMSAPFVPMKGLKDPEAVPFLIDVMINGPDWQDEELLTMHGGILPHLADVVLHLIWVHTEIPAHMSRLLKC